MKCPICIEVDLLITEREGVTIDYCPRCRGIWLERGELDKIIERSLDWYLEEPDEIVDIPEKPKRGHPPPASPRHPPPASSRRRQRPPSKPRRKKRKSFLKELADWLDDIVD